MAQPINHDRSLGMVVGIWLAQRDETLSKDDVKREANSFYEKASAVIMLERCPFVEGFQEAYFGYLGGLV